MSNPDSIDTSEYEVDFDPQRAGSRIRERLLVLIGIGILVAVGVVVVQSAGDADQPSAEAVDGDSADNESPDAEGQESTDEQAPESALDAAGQYDGLDSLRFPLAIVPDSGLVDGQLVEVTGSGFGADISVAIIQCAGVIGGGSVEDCDLSAYQLGSTDAQGNISMSYEVRRYIGTAAGEVDCLDTTEEFGCAIAIGNINDYDESGVGRISFAPDVDGQRAPTLTIDRTVGLRDGDELVVTGRQFDPETTVEVGQCVIGGPTGFDTCFTNSTTLLVDTDANGEFTVTVTASRHLDGLTDCVDDVYGCRLGARGLTASPNPVRLFYDGSVRAPEGVALTLSQNSDLVDGSVITIQLSEVAIDGEVQAVQCVDQGVEIGVTCGEVTVAEVINGAAEFSVVVQQTFVNAAGGTVDCGEAGRVCELRITGVHTHTAPLQFAGAAG